ncbi:MAG TPA: helix-turn-helix domain-containing protein [Sphingomicrobium sp.]|nr:helix-turn-helix domain-containing protein [Sphingomicrobium sp.]
MKNAFDKIMAGIEDVTACARGDGTRANILRPIDIKALRAKRNMTQGEFARAYRLPIGTVRDWEQHRREPDTGSKLYLSMIEADPEGVQKILMKV